MASKKAHSSTTQKSTAQSTNLTQPCDDIDLLDQSGVDISIKGYTSLLSNNDFSEDNVRAQPQRSGTDSVYWSIQGVSGSESAHKTNASQIKGKRV